MCLVFYLAALRSTLGKTTSKEIPVYWELFLIKVHIKQAKAQYKQATIMHSFSGSRVLSDILHPLLNPATTICFLDKKTEA